MWVTSKRFSNNKQLGIWILYYACTMSFDSGTNDENFSTQTPRGFSWIHCASLASTILQFRIAFCTRRLALYGNPSAKTRAKAFYSYSCFLVTDTTRKKCLYRYCIDLLPTPTHAMNTCSMKIWLQEYFANITNIYNIIFFNIFISEFISAIEQNALLILLYFIWIK